MNQSEDTPVPPRLGMWERLADAATDHFRVFRVRRTRYRHPRDRREGEFVVIEANDWFNVLALTDDGRMLMVRQFRFAALDTLSAVLDADYLTVG